MESIIIPEFKESLFSQVYEVIPDYLEIGIDSIFENECLKQIPIVKSIISVCKIGYNINERNLLKQTLAFISEFNSNTISEEKLKEYRNKLEKDPERTERELGRIIIILGQQIEQIQSRVLSCFMCHILKGQYQGINFVSFQKQIGECLL